MLTALPNMAGHSRSALQRGRVHEHRITQCDRMKAAFGNQREMVRSGHEAKLQVECQAVVSQLQEGKRQSDQLQTV